jgi:uncharacterized protein YycO
VSNISVPTANTISIHGFCEQHFCTYRQHYKHAGIWWEIQKEAEHWKDLDIIIIIIIIIITIKLNSVTWVRERTIPTEWPPLVYEVSANFCA